MATVFISKRRYRVAVNSLDHLPPHVHAFGKGLEARFILNCPNGPVQLWDLDGRWTLAHVGELGREIADAIEACCRTWERTHGSV